MHALQQRQAKSLVSARPRSITQSENVAQRTPLKVKLDNHPAYTAREFCLHWVLHIITNSVLYGTTIVQYTPLYPSLVPTVSGEGWGRVCFGMHLDT